MLLLTVLLAACSTLPGPAPTELDISRALKMGYQPRPEYHPAPFNVAVYDAMLVQDVYQAALSLPSPSPGIISCTLDRGLQYHLTFLQHSKQVLTMTADASGCRTAILNGKVNRVASDALFSTLARALHMPFSAVVPVPVFPTSIPSPTTP
jgi:hypothetical protein